MNTSSADLFNELKVVHAELIIRMDRLKTSYHLSNKKNIEVISEIRPLKVLEERIKFHLLNLEYGQDDPNIQAIRQLIKKGHETIERSTQLLTKEKSHG